jgi:hypothetical protein
VQTRTSGLVNKNNKIKSAETQKPKKQKQKKKLKTKQNPTNKLQTTNYKNKT